MKRFLRNLMIVNVMIALGLGIAGVVLEWPASTFTVALFALCGGLLIIGSFALGGSGPPAHIGMGTGPAAAMGAVVQGEEVVSAYAAPGRKKGDFLPAWRARHGWVQGSSSVSLTLLATGVMCGIAGTISGLVFE